MTLRRVEVFFAIEDGEGLIAAHEFGTPGVRVELTRHVDSVDVCLQIMDTISESKLMQVKFCFRSQDCCFKCVWVHRSTQ